MSVSASDPNDPKVQAINEAAAVIIAARQVEHSAPGHWAGALYEAGLLNVPVPAPSGDEPESVTATPEHATGVNIPTRIDVLTNEPGTATPLMLDLGTDTCIVLQPKTDQGDHELALNIVVGNGLPVEVVAWMLGQAAETLVNGIRNSPFIRPVG